MLPSVPNKSKTTLIVTAANSKYYPLCLGLVQSLRGLKDGYAKDGMTLVNNPLETYRIAIAVMDGGLEPEQIAKLQSYDVIVKQVPFLFDFPQGSVPKPHYNGFVERCNLPKHFPGYETYMWMDADTWVQDFNIGVRPYLQFAAKGHLAIVPEVDRNIAFNEHHQNITVGWAHGNYSKYFGEEVAAAYCRKPMFNNGVFAARADNPVWELWESAMYVALLANNYKPEFGIDQISLNYVIYSAPEAKAYPLPLVCNWMVTHAMPVIDNFDNTLREPLWPHEMIGVVHLLENTKWNRVGINRIDPVTSEQVGGDSIHLEYWSFSNYLPH